MEILKSGDRKPAIDPEKLRLPNGLFANKYSLLLHAYESGLPVPEIVPETHLQAHFNQLNLIDQTADPERYWIESDKNKLYRRGYFPEPIDMWTVNTLPTAQLRSPQDNSLALDTLKETISNSSLNAYLQRNFSLKTIPETASFLQKSWEGATYFSTWTYGNEMYGSIGKDKGTQHFSLDRKTGNVQNTSEIFIDADQELIKQKLFPLAHEIESFCNGLLRGKFDYKIDFLCNYDDFTGIQIRVASIKTYEKTKKEAKKKIREFIKNGVSVYHAEVGKLKRLPKDPYILNLTNDHHLGNLNQRTQLTLDMSQMRGLILPSHLRGGLLQHNGYVLIAYALYWGLPIAITNNIDDI